MIRFVYFDVGGTLITARPSVGSVYAAAGRPFGLMVESEVLEHEFRIAFPEQMLLKGRADFACAKTPEDNRFWWRGLVFRVLDRVGFGGDREGVFEACYASFATADAWRVYDDARPALDTLATRNMPMGVLSNWDHRLEPLLVALDLAKYFGPFVVSAVEGIEKPDRRIFELACQRAGCAPDEVAYVGDDPFLDLEPALALGIHAYLIDRRGRSTSTQRIDLLTQLLERCAP